MMLDMMRSLKKFVNDSTILDASIFDPSMSRSSPEACKVGVEYEVRRQAGVGKAG